MGSTLCCVLKDARKRQKTITISSNPMPLSMGKREKPQPVSWKSQLSPPSSHLSIVIAYFFYRCTAVRTSSNSSVSPEIAIRATMNNDRSSGGSSNGTTPPPSAGNDHEVAPPPPYPTFGGLLDAEVSFDGEQGPPARSAGPAGLAGSVGLRQRLHFFYSHRWHHASWPASGLPSGMRTVTVTV